MQGEPSQIFGQQLATGWVCNSQLDSRPLVVVVDVAVTLGAGDWLITALVTLLGLGQLAVEGLHVQAQSPLIDVLLLGVGHHPVVLQQPVIRHPQVLLRLGPHGLQRCR